MDALTLLEGMRLYWKGQKPCLGACHALELERKKRLLKRHVSKIPVILKTVNLIKTIVDGMVRMNDTVQNER